MRGAPQTMKVLRPQSVTEAVEIYGRYPHALPLAGGTDFMVGWNAGWLNDRTVLDLSALRSWSRLRVLGDGLRIGALATHWQLRRHPIVREKLPLLAQACATIGGVQIQERGTLGGNIANASPAADTFPPLAVYEARVRTISARGGRVLPFLSVFTGVKKTALEPAELIESIEIPFLSSRPRRSLFRKVGTRAASAISKTVGAGLIWLYRDGRIRELRYALGSMAPTVRRLTTVETYVCGKKPTASVLRRARELMGVDVSPIDDLRSTAEYRRDVSANLLCELLGSR